MGKWPLFPKVKDNKPKEASGGAAEIQNPSMGQVVPLVAGAVGGLGEEVVEQVVGGSGAESSDIRQAEEGEGNLKSALELVVDALPFLVAGFPFTFLDMMRLVQQPMYYNDHIVLRHHSGCVQRAENPAYSWEE
ncbi:Cancer/Testis Antigen 47A [Manis pentadactyla]|nr:Cancer/Testis Antigen 47A [Manis pentadactyla]